MVVECCRKVVCAVFTAILAIGVTTYTQQFDYVVGPQDVLAITVWDQADLAGKFAVEADGTFTFPLVGRLKAGGLTLRQVEAEVIRRLKDGFFINPQVTVAVEQYRSQRVFVVGEVRSPGTQSLTGGMSLIEALARAGSTLPSAGDEAIIVRPPPGTIADAPLLPDVAATDGKTPVRETVLAGAAARQAAVIRIDIRDLQKGVLDQNIRLFDGDTVFVPRAPTIFVFGQVKGPGEYAIKTETTVLQALTLAGGVTDRGATGRIKVVRLVNGAKKEVNVRLDDLVIAGDTLIVPERFF